MEDFAEVKGQEHVKRAMEIAAAGAHNLLMVGPPGAGKTMLARRLTSILPPLTFEEAIETTKIYSVVGLLRKNQALITERQFRAPHHTISDAGLIGGGALPRPGEVSLAHNGVLFLDELPEYKKHVIEVLRQPLEDRCVTISRAATSITFPSSFMLVAAMNPCPCGYATDAGQRCCCTSSQIQRYRSKISGPLMDRIDMHVDVPAVSYQELAALPASGESSVIRQRVIQARQLQSVRFQRDGIYCNAQMGNRHIRTHCILSSETNAMLQAAAEKFGLSVRAIFRILKMARTIADLDREQSIGPAHLAEAIQFRIQS
jgi:magnesium chelatase family protein